eukprot:m.881 g.881  ORF g.881 m.881 type:complete len:52 (-) comp820_c0_seq1:62-217(-)
MCVSIYASSVCDSQTYCERTVLQQFFNSSFDRKHFSAVIQQKSNILFFDDT